jgi:hypothetical protein
MANQFTKKFIHPIMQIKWKMHLSEYVYMTKFVFAVLKLHSYDPPQMRTKILLTL